MPVHVIVGAGAVGSTTADLLAERGEEVRIVSRSGSGPDHPAIERVTADASDADRLSALSEGAVALYNTASPLYHQWLTNWPPLARALRIAAERSGAVLTTAANLYPYGPVAAPMTEETPLAATHPKLRIRGDIWLADLAAHNAGRIRATEVRASDYIEANSILSFVLAKPLLAGKRAYAPAKLDVPHSFTSIKDVARMLVTVASDERAWGRAWHVPTNDPLTVRELARQFAEVAGAPAARISTLPFPALWVAGMFDPIARELRTTYYQWTRPFVLDSTLAQETFGIRPTPMAEALRATVDASAAAAPNA